MKYKLKDEDKILSVLIFYQKSLSNELIDTTLFWIDEWSIPMITKEIENYIYEIFPNPYHV